MSNFWSALPQPFYVLAPMENVTDTVFRQIITSVGKPDVFVTEFTHVDAILHNASMGRLDYTEEERPIVAQIWGTDPKSFFEAAKVVKQLKFDGVDINMGCPVRDIIKQGGCSALIGQEKLVAEIIAATKEGASELPVSVKTRIGRKKIETEEWLGFLLEQDIAALTVHGRTAAEMSKVPAHWDEIAKAVALRNAKKGCQTLVIGNGDVKSLTEARLRIQETQVDGVMIGRGIFENIGVFVEKNLTVQERKDLLIKHMELFESTWGVHKHFQIIKKFVKAYINGYDGAAHEREKLMQANSLSEIRAML